MLVITIMGLAYVGSGASGYKGATKSLATQQALCLAESGIEDARMKLEKDSYFPPPQGDEGKVFSYTEDVLDIGGGNPMGSFEVVVDKTHGAEPYYIIRLTSTGRQQEAVKSVRAEIDICPFDRKDPTKANPNLYHIINWSEEGILQ